MSNKQKVPVAPKLRFPEFRGEREWEMHALSSVAMVVMGSSPKSEFYNEDHDGLPLLQGNADIKNRLSAPRIFTSEITKECHVNDILMSVRAPVGSVAKAIHHACIGRGIASIHSKKPNSQEFLYQWLLSYESRWANISQGGTFDAINSDDLKGVVLTTPLPTEQQKIADCLSSLDEFIAAQARKVDALKTHKKGLMQQLFPREGETQPRLRFPEFRDAGGWEEACLGDYFDPIRNGFVGTATPYYTTSEGVRYLQGRNIKQGKIETENLIYITSDFHNRQRKSHLKTGDILMVQSGHVGECAVVGTDFAGANCHALVILTPRRKLSSEFFRHYFYAPIGLLAIFQITTGNTIKHILASELKTLPVLVPGSAEQQRIADCLTSLDTLITAATQELETLKTHKKGLMQQLFPSAEAAEV